MHKHEIRDAIITAINSLKAQGVNNGDLAAVLAEETASAFTYYIQEGDVGEDNKRKITEAAITIIRWAM